MVAPDFETTVTESTPSTEDQQTQPKVAVTTKDHQAEATDLMHKFKQYLNKKITPSGPSTKTEDKPMKPKLTDKAKDLISMKTYACDCDCPSTEVSAHPPLTLALPTIPSLIQHVACLPALARHAHTCLPYEEESFRLGQKLDEAAQEVISLQRKRVWFVNEELPLVQRLADDMGPLLRKLAGQLKDQPLGKGGWEKASSKVWRAREAVRVSAEPRKYQGLWVATSVHKLGEGEVEKLTALVPGVMRELERLSEDTATWCGCRTCAGHMILILRDVIDSLSKIEGIVCAGMMMVWGANASMLLAQGHPFKIPQTVREVRKAAERAESLSRRTGELMNRFQRWSEVIAELWEVNEGKEIEDGIGEGL